MTLNACMWEGSALTLRLMTVNGVLHNMQALASESGIQTGDVSILGVFPPKTGNKRITVTSSRGRKLQNDIGSMLAL